MSKSMKYLLSVLCVSLVGICQAAERLNVSALPISNRLIQGEMVLANGEALKFTVLEGKLLTVQGPEVGSFALSGEILSEEPAQVRFTVFEIQEFGPGRQGLKQVEQIEVRGKETMAAVVVDLPAIQVSGIHESPKVTQDDVLQFRQAKMNSLAGIETKEKTQLSDSTLETLGGDCCVTCGSTTACGCAVSMSCGSCCAPGCCSSGNPYISNRD